MPRCQSDRFPAIPGSCSVVAVLMVIYCCNMHEEALNSVSDGAQTNSISQVQVALCMTFRGYRPPPAIWWHSGCPTAACLTASPACLTTWFMFACLFGTVYHSCPQLQEQLRSDQARLTSQQSQLESWQSQLAEQQAQLEQLEAQAADALNEAREAAAAVMADRDQVCSTCIVHAQLWKTAHA